MFIVLAIVWAPSLLRHPPVDAFEALWWHEIAAKHGLICPYGHHDNG
jgi:hypothetical protein